MNTSQSYMGRRVPPPPVDIVRQSESITGNRKTVLMHVDQVPGLLTGVAGTAIKIMTLGEVRPYFLDRPVPSLIGMTGRGGKVQIILPSLSK